MIIHEPRLLQEENSVVLWTRVTRTPKAERFPGYLWFRIPNEYAEHISTQSDPFLISALAPAMYFGESIEVEGTVSPRLAYHLEEHMYITRMMFPDIMHAVDVQFDRLASLPGKPPAVGMVFSGGVDSFFTLQHHLPATQQIPEYHVSHAVYINGFDLVRGEKYKFQPRFQNYRNLLRNFQVDLIPVETNLASMILPWLTYNRFFSPLLIGSAMALGGLFKRFMISSSWSHSELKRINAAANPLSDRFLSTDTLEIEHFGADYLRIDKVESIHDWEPVLTNLKVCIVGMREEDTLNCGRCEKCMRTMIPLYALGNLDDFTVFDRSIKSNRDLLNWARKFNPALGFIGETFAIARKHRPQMLPWLWVAFLLGTIRYGILHMIPGFVIEYLKRFGFFVSHIKEENAFDDLELTARLQSLEGKT